jgi:hypothetical protein
MSGFITFIVLLISLYLPQGNTLESVLERHYAATNLSEKSGINTIQLSGDNFFYRDDSTFKSNQPFLSGTYSEYVIKNRKYYVRNEDRVTDGTQTFLLEYWINEGEAWKRQNGEISDWEFGIADSLYISSMISIEGPLYKWKEKGYQLEYLGKKKIEGKNYDCIHVFTPQNSQVYYYLHPRTGLITWKSNYAEYDPSYKNQAFLYADYRKVNGIYFPFYTESRSYFMGNTTYVVRRFKKIILNERIPGSIFERPKE